MSNHDLFFLLEQFLNYGIVGILIFMSFLVVWLFIERILFYKNIKFDNYLHRDSLELDLTNNLSIISVVGSNAPYVGLLGTVIGIMLTFYSMGDVDTIDAKQIMLGLALSLKATAMGLLVAIPATISYTISLRKVERILTQYDILQDTTNNG